MKKSARREQTKRYEAGLTAALRGVFKDVEPQWDAFKGEKLGKYSPRVDIAIGPFSTGAQQLEVDYDSLFQQHKERFGRLFDRLRATQPWLISLEYANGHNYNRNARCFIAIEIEASRDPKHMIGDVVNACSMGRFGVVIADNRTRPSFEAIVKYFRFLDKIKGIRFLRGNLVLCTRSDFSHFSS